MNKKTTTQRVDEITTRMNTIRANMERFVNDNIGRQRPSPERKYRMGALGKLTEDELTVLGGFRLLKMLKKKRTALCS